MAADFLFKSTRLWQKAIDMAILVNQAMRTFPEHEKQQNGLCCILLTAAVRVPSRIAESHEPFLRNPAELLSQARFHLTETRQLLDIADQQGYLNSGDHYRIHDSCDDLNEMLNQHLLQYQPRGFMSVVR